MFREIRTREKMEKFIDKKEEKGYLKIKPQTDITVDEAKDFWNQMLNDLRKEA